MLITYKPADPADGEGGRWQFEPGRVRQSEAAVVEKVYGSSWDKFLGELQMGSVKARRVLLWHLMRRDGNTLNFASTPDFFMDEFLVEMNVAEWQAARERVLKQGLSEDDLATALTMIDAEIAAAEERDDLGGKATSRHGPTDG